MFSPSLATVANAMFSMAARVQVGVMKNVLKGMLAHHLMRHHQNRRFLHSLGAPMLALGRTKGMLMFGALALGAELLRRRKAARTATLPQVPH